jgi:hypothetical protein
VDHARGPVDVAPAECSKLAETKPRVEGESEDRLVALLEGTDHASRTCRVTGVRARRTEPEGSATERVGFSGAVPSCTARR